MDKYSADSFRFLMLSSPLTNGENFSLADKDVADVARKLSMIWNMYDFFTIYAEVDDFTFPYASSSPDVTIDTLKNPLDIWVVSRVHQLAKEVEECTDAYDLQGAVRPILPFIDDASNWYVRRSRRRFWKSEDDSDKNDAYRTLHYVLMKLAVVLAPFTPFLAEELYHKLGGSNESVHLLDWPTNYAINEAVMNEMDTVRDYVNQGLSLRAKAGLKVRQPLASVTVPKLGEHVDFAAILEEELNVKQVNVGTEIALDETVTPELKLEGLMRDVVRYVQNARKNAGLNVDDRIVLNLTTENSELQQAIHEHLETVKTETLATEFAENDGYKETVEIEGNSLIIRLSKS